MAPDPDALNRLGNDLKAEGRSSEAEEAYRRAVMVDPSRAAPWFNLGLLYKLLRRWEDSVRCGLRATQLDPEDEGAWWNLGIAATALGNWRLARRAWRGCGIEIDDGDDPPSLDYGPVPIRLSPEDSGEVVWCDRIDPARAVIRSVPLPASGFHELDVVLHDGESRGYRILEGRSLPVFDALGILERSGRQTFAVRVAARSEEDVAALVGLAESMGITVEDWTQTVRPICRRCSEDVPHEEHDEPAPVPWSPERRIGISAGAAAEAEELLDRWRAGSPDRAVIDKKEAR